MNDLPDNELLSAYLDGELTAEERAQVEHLLATKPAAGKLLDELRSLSAALKSLPRQQLGEDLSENVLRIAERRRLTEKMGTGSAEVPVPIFSEPSPIYSTILRRLKNPRLWVWEIVIVAVAVLLMVYYPNQNANRNVAAPGNAERNIAMASKPEVKQTITERTSDKRAVQSPDLGDRNELSALRKSGGEAGKTDALGRLEGVEKPAEGKSAAAPERSALDRADLAKKDGVTFSDKLAAKDMPKAAFKAAAKGAAAAAESAAPPSTPAAGLTIQSQSQSGGPLIAETVNASNSLSQNKPAEPPAEKEAGEKESADRATGKAASADELLVVHCEITPEAVKNHAFDKILADNAIVWSETPKENRDAENLSAIELSKAGPLEIVYVEASPAQIEAALNGLSAQTDAFKNVSVASSKEDSRLQHAVAGANFRREIPKSALEARARIAQTAEPAGGQSQFGFKTDSSTSTKVVLGRAQHIPFSYGYNAKASGVATEDQKQSLAGTAQKALLPETIQLNSSAQAVQNQLDIKQEQQPARSAQNRQDAYSPRNNFHTEPSGQAASPRIGRVLFVFQVIEPKNTTRNSEQNAPANSAGADAKAPEANPAKQQNK
ncbi:MAG: zf-HC2 domain-containing protein [Thermoguttaceae bacterium]